MSIASEITRITSLRDRIRDKLIALGLLPSTPVQQGGNDLFDCTEAIEDIGGTKYMTGTGTVDVAPYQYARVNDANLIPSNIVENVTILGVTGTASVTPPSANLQQGHLYYGGAAAPSSLYPSQGYDGFSQVVVERTDVNPTLLPQNVRYGVTIMGVAGNLHRLQNKSVTFGSAMPSTQTPTSPYDGLSQVSFSLDSSVINAENIRSGVSILGVTGTCGNFVINGSQATPTADTRSITFDFDLPTLKKVKFFEVYRVPQQGNGSLFSIFFSSAQWSVPSASSGTIQAIWSGRLPAGGFIQNVGGYLGFSIQAINRSYRITLTLPNDDVLFKNGEQYNFDYGYLT